jgi:hypothetical protein
MYYHVLEYMYYHTNIYTPKKPRIYEVMYCHVLPYIAIYRYVLLCIVMYYYVSSCITMYYHVLEYMYCHTKIYTPKKPRIDEVMNCHLLPYTFVYSNTCTVITTYIPLKNLKFLNPCTYMYIYYHINICTDGKSTIYEFDIFWCVIKDQLLFPPILVWCYLETFSIHNEYKLSTTLQEIDVNPLRTVVHTYVSLIFQWRKRLFSIKLL